MRRLSVCIALMLSITMARAVSPLVVYGDGLSNGFNDRTWADAGHYSLSDTTPAYGGVGTSIGFRAQGWNGLQFVADGSEFNLADYQSLTFYVHGGAAGGQKLQAYVCDDYNAVSAQYPLDGLIAGGVIPANAWAPVTLDFDNAGLTSGTFNCVVIMDADGANDAATGQPDAYIDQIVFNPRTSPLPGGGSVDVQVDVSADVHSFSPLIFGVAFGDATRNAQVGYTVDRWGGNSTTRYNWQIDMHNTGSDYYFENIPDCTAPTCVGTPPAGNSADTFVADAFAGGAQPMMTIPTIGWTPRSNSALNHPYTVGFAVSKYGAQQSVDPYDSNAGNGYHTDGTPITGNDATDASSAAPPAFEQQWIAHMQSTFGTAANGGVKLFALDNEVMLWNSTHRDVHPNPATYDEIWGKAEAYAAAIKQQDPDALVTGPVTWGYCDLFTSAADAAAGNCLDGSDRQNHGGVPFVAWYLKQVCDYQQQHGVRLVDYLDLHYYPQGSNVSLSDDDSAATAALRLRSLKELYNPSWVSESWMGSLGDVDANHYDKPDLIPRVRAWIDQYCPGTKLAITEYNWGNDNTASGAVAQAEALAIFAREGVDLATRWVAPSADSRVERAYSLFLNYDGAGARVSGDSVAAVSSNVDQIGAYAFHLDGRRTMVLVTNKDTQTHDVVVHFATARHATWSLYGFTGTSALTQIGSGGIAGNSLTLQALPPISASLLVVPEVDVIFADGFDPSP